MRTPNELPGFAVPSLRGERRYATVLMADIVNSTQLLEAVGSEAWVEIMNRVFQIAGSEIYRYGGEIDQFRGDGLVAFFGATSAHENDPERAILAGLRLQVAMETYAAQLTQERSVALKLRVGVNTGEVIVTQVGDRARHFEQTAMGAAVALAARMEAAAEPGTVLVSEKTHRLVAEKFEWLPLGEIRAKGVSRPVAVYRPLGHLEAEGPSGSRRGRESLGGLDSPLVGRQAEFRALQRAVRALHAGRGGVVTVVGEAGIGKSRLVAEVRTRESLGPTDEAPDAMTPADRTPAPRRPLLWIEGRCLSLGSAAAYLPWISILRQLLGLRSLERADASPAERRALLRERIAALGIGDGPTRDDTRWAEGVVERHTVVDTVGRLLGLHRDDHRSARAVGGAEVALAGVAHAVTAVITAVARRCPLVLTFEDLHWADVASLQLLARMLPLVERLPLLLICVMRPVAEAAPESAEALRRLRAAFSEAGAAKVLHLTSLAPPQIDEMIAHLLASCAEAPADAVDARTARPGLPPDVLSSILAASGGNPYFVEEMVRSLMDRDLVTYDALGCYWKAGEWTVTDVPDSLRGVLTARMDRLPPAARRCLQVGAVIGRIFSRDLLAAVLVEHAAVAPAAEAPAAQLDDALRLLVDAQMIRPREDARGQYIFKHQLMQEAAYDSLLQGERRWRHRRVAEALEEGGAQSEARAAMVAHHWEAAGETRRAIPYHLRTGRQAQRVHAHDAARAAFARALAGTKQAQAGDALLDLARWQYEAHVGLGQVAFSVGQVDRAEAALREALTLGAATGAPRGELIRLYHWLSEVLFWQERYEERFELGEEGLALIDPTEETVEAALVNQMVAIGRLVKGDNAGFRVYTLRTAAFIADLPYVAELLPAYEHIAKVHIMAGELDRAEALLGELRARAIAAHPDDDLDLAVAAAIRRQQGEIRAARGDLASALSTYGEALALYERLGDTKHRVWSMGDMGWISLQMGDLAGAERWLAEMRRTAPTLSHYQGLDHILQGDVLLGLAQGDADAALAAAETLLSNAAGGDGGAGDDPLDAAGTASPPPLRAAWPYFLIGQAHWVAAKQACAAAALEGGQVDTDIGGCRDHDHNKEALENSARESALASFTLALTALAQREDDALAPAAMSILNAIAEVAGFDGATAALEVSGLRVPWGRVTDVPAALPVGAAWLASAGSVAAPAPASVDERGGWIWQDPLGGCDLVWRDPAPEAALPNRSGLPHSFAIRAANGRSLWQANTSAPRLVHRAAGDLTLQARVEEADPGWPCIGGLLLMWDAATYLRFDVGMFGPRSVAYGAARAVDGAASVAVLGGSALAMPIGNGGVWLRLERRASTVTALVSLDGASWMCLGQMLDAPTGPVRAGLYAVGSIDRAIYHGAFPDGSGVHFRDVVLAMWPPNA